MFINKLNQLYKPKRALYYLDIDSKEIESFYVGVINDPIKQYQNAFGTYDYPGLFYLKKLNKYVIGIEYRINDDRINYPKDLNSLILDESYYYSIEIENDNKVNLDFINNLFKQIKKDDDAKRNYSNLIVKDESDTIAIFASNKKIRILYECDLVNSRASIVMYDKKEFFDKDELYNLSFIDPITNHYNWNHLVPYLEIPKDKGIYDYAFVHFDVKEFRIINEVYGHIAANKVLSNIAKKMKDSDFIYASARCHNDNFCMMIKDMPYEETIEKLTNFFNDLSHLEEDPNYTIYYRCGLVLMQRSILSGNRVADFAKLAQKLGTNSNKTDIIVYTDKMHEDMLWGNYIKAYLDTAIKNDEFVVYLQPKFDLSNEKIEGAEALIRWNYKNKEFLAPYKFIPFFENDSSISKIDNIVLDKVCQALAKWKKENKNLYPISVNLSRKELYDKNLIKNILKTVDKYGINHDLIDFELTESATYDNRDMMIQILNELRSNGFRISMDDFGTGYSSLSLLKEMPLDTLKIDKSFVDNIGTVKENEKDYIVLKYIISLAKNLSFTCLAEGAETKMQVDRLKMLGCEIIQGYYYSKPISIEEFEKKYLN